MLIDLLNSGYTLQPLYTQADLSAASLQTALIMLKFDLSKEQNFELGLTRNDISLIQSIVTGIIPIKVTIDESLSNYQWYLVEHNNKKIIYCGGA